MVRRALSLRRGSTLGLEIDTNPDTFSTEVLSQSLPNSNYFIARSQKRRNSTANDSIQSPRERLAGGRLPLSRHHQNVRKQQSMSSMTVNAGNNTTSTTARPTRSKNPTRGRTNSSSTSVSLISTNSFNVRGSFEFLGTSPVGNRAGGLSSMMDDDELATIIADDEFDGDRSRSGSDRSGGRRLASHKAKPGSGEP